ncbi:hypothetical protein PQE68_gp129 [Bacillus phage vB_BanS_Sophrita]|uniref:Uncharacterized protein n=1 Tax=Bacillus phage vB_BanS_Sophrita TaxID=2894790 RepID=A0AAE8YTY8_9CAUD|nr:hypothetical protein PQE68_gp129 [Bacillus phage vB_BanS_Sophrita]UGO50720.1 hypothetical protein SOPHRITA_129 [Bacillus phage vB_BanS_Sophrita]
MFWIENIMQTLSMVGIVMASYNMIHWWKKDKLGRSSVNFVMFMIMFLIYDVSEFIYVGA